VRIGMLVGAQLVLQAVRAGEQRVDDGAAVLAGGGGDRCQGSRAGSGTSRVSSND
jgi:hypothetical protein